MGEIELEIQEKIIKEIQEKIIKEMQDFYNWNYCITHYDWMYRSTGNIKYLKAQRQLIKFNKIK